MRYIPIYDDNLVRDLYKRREAQELPVRRNKQTEDNGNRASSSRR